MNGRTLAQVLLRVWGVMLIVFAVASVGNVLLFLIPPGDAPATTAWRAGGTASAVQMAIYLIAGVFLLRNGDRLGAWLVSDLDDPGPPASSAAVEGIAFRLA